MNTLNSIGVMAGAFAALAYLAGYAVGYFTGRKHAREAAAGERGR